MSLKRRLTKAESRLRAAEYTRKSDHYRNDPVGFAEQALGIQLDPWQREVVAGNSKRDILNCSRQAGKSTVASIIALHEAIYRPKSLTILVSPSQRQSSELFRKVTDLRQRLPDSLVLTEDNKLSMAIAGGGRVVSLPSSEATIRGYSGATLIIEDEASRVPDELYQAVRPMLATSNGRMILMSTPFGKRGHYFETWSDAPGWRRVQVTAAEVPRISAGFLEEEKATHTESWYLQEYFGVFVDAERAAFGYDIVMAALDDTITPLFEAAA